MNLPEHQRGVALISVMLVFALVAIIASQISSRNYRDIRKTANLTQSKQAYQYALAGEQFARQLLYRDFVDGNDDEGNSSVGESNRLVDRLTDNWAQINQTFEIDNGAMTIEVRDLQGLFNLNNLINQHGYINGHSSSLMARLLDSENLDNRYLVLLLDWIDPDNNVRGNGAEDEHYADYGYQTANMPLVDRSELKLLVDFNPLDYQRLQSLVVALPVLRDGKHLAETKYNINTLDAKLIAGLSPTITNAEVARIVEQQQRGGYSSMAAWANSGLLAPLGTNVSRLQVFSEYFELLIKVNYDQRISVLRSQLLRDKNSGSISIIKRQQGLE